MTTRHWGEGVEWPMEHAVNGELKILADEQSQAYQSCLSPETLSYPSPVYSSVLPFHLLEEHERDPLPLWPQE